MNISPLTSPDGNFAQLISSSFVGGVRRSASRRLETMALPTKNSGRADDQLEFRPATLRVAGFDTTVGLAVMSCHQGWGRNFVTIVTSVSATITKIWLEK